MARAHSSTSRWPPLAAKAVVHLSHGQPCSRAHLSISRWPPPAAQAHVLSFHGQPLACAHLSTSRRPPCAAGARRLVPRAAALARPLEHVEALASPRGARRLVPRARARAPLEHVEWPSPAAKEHVHLSHGQPCSCAHLSTSRWPPRAAKSTSARPTGSRARAPTRAPRGGRRAPRGRTSVRPTAAARARPLQQPQVATPSRGRAELVFLRLLQLLARLSRLERDERAPPRASDAGGAGPSPPPLWRGRSGRRRGGRGPRSASRADSSRCWQLRCRCVRAATSGDDARTRSERRRRVGARMRTVSA